MKGKVKPQLEAWIIAGHSNWRDDNFYDQTFLRLGFLLRIQSPLGRHSGRCSRQA